MKSKNDESTQRVLLLLKIDANNLFSRIKNRKLEYLEVFASRRTRVHFPMIFNNRYETSGIHELSHCSTELITVLDQFYTISEEMSWYLYKTEDMPATVEHFIERKIKRMSGVLQSLNLFLNAELGIEGEEEVISTPAFIDVPELGPDDLFTDSPESDIP